MCVSRAGRRPFRLWWRTNNRDIFFSFQFEQATESDGKRPRDSEDDGEEEGGRSRRAGETSSEAVSMATDQFSDSEEESTEEAVSMSLKERLADQEEEKVMLTNIWLEMAWNIDLLHASARMCV